MCNKINVQKNMLKKNGSDGNAIQYKYIKTRNNNTLVNIKGIPPPKFFKNIITKSSKKSNAVEQGGSKNRC